MMRILRACSKSSMSRALSVVNTRTTKGATFIPTRFRYQCLSVSYVPKQKFWRWNSICHLIVDVLYAAD
jgi:hypothetical protein